jgi:hypothetical protein
MQGFAAIWRIDSVMLAHVRRALPPLTSTLLELSQRHLSEPGGVRDMAGVLLGRLLTRPDCGAALQDFLAWAHSALQEHDSPRAVFTVPGVKLNQNSGKLWA